MYVCIYITILLHTRRIATVGTRQCVDAQALYVWFDDVGRNMKLKACVGVIRQGMCQYADGNRYEGEWRNNLPHGAGSCRFQVIGRFQ